MDEGGGGVKVGVFIWEGGSGGEGGTHGPYIYNNFFLVTLAP